MDRMRALVLGLFLAAGGGVAVAEDLPELTAGQWMYVDFTPGVTTAYVYQQGAAATPSSITTLPPTGLYNSTGTMQVTNIPGYGAGNILNGWYSQTDFGLVTLNNTTLALQTVNIAPSGGLSVSYSAGGDIDTLAGVQVTGTSTAPVNVVYSGGDIDVSASVSKANVIGGEASLYGLKGVNGDLTMQSGDISLGGSVTISEASVQADAVGVYVDGVGNATSQAVTVSGLSHTATGNGKAGMIGTIGGAYTANGNATANGLVTLTNITSSATVDNVGVVGLQWTAGSEYNYVAALSKSGTAQAHSLNVNGIRQTFANECKEENNATASIYVHSNIVGAWASGDATVTGTVTVTDAAFTASVAPDASTPNGMGGVAFAAGSVVGAFSNNGNASSGTVSIDGVYREASNYSAKVGGVITLDGDIYSGSAASAGSLAGAVTRGADKTATVNGNVTITDASFKADAKWDSGDGFSFISPDAGKADAHGYAAGAMATEGTALVTGSVSLEGKDGKKAVTREATSISGYADASDAIYGAFAGTDGTYGGDATVVGSFSVAGAKYTATAGREVKTGDTPLAQTNGMGGAALADGEIIGAYSALGSATVGSVSIRDVERTATSHSSTGIKTPSLIGFFEGSAIAGGFYGGAMTIFGDARVAGDVLMENITHNASEKWADGKATGANPNGASADGIFCGAFSGNSQAAVEGSVTIRDIDLDASSMTEMAVSDSTVYGALGIDSASVGGLITISGISASAKSTTTFLDPSFSNGNLAQSGIDIIGASSGTGAASVGGLMTVSDLSVDAESTMAGASGELSVCGARSSTGSGSGSALVQSLSVSTLSASATSTGTTLLANAQIRSYIVGAGSGGGTAEVTGAVAIQGGGTSVMEAVAGMGNGLGGVASVNTQYMGAVSYADSATVGGFTVEGIAHRATNHSVGGGLGIDFGARFSSTIVGAFAPGQGLTSEGDATVNGDVRIADLSYEANALYNGPIGSPSEGNADGNAYVCGAVAQYGSASVTGGVTVENLTFSTASTSNNALFEGMAGGAYSFYGDASVSGDTDIAVSSSVSSAAAAPTAVASNRLLLYGVRAGESATVGGDVSVRADTVTTTANGASRDVYGYAAGVTGLKEITVSRGTDSIDVTAETYAFGLSTSDINEEWHSDAPEYKWNPDAPHQTTINGPVHIVAEATGAGQNNTLSREVPDPAYTPGVIGSEDFGLHAREARPVKSAEYLGLGSADTLTLNIGSGETMDNEGDAFRVFGAETVNISSGTLSLAEGSYFINQKDYSTAPGNDIYDTLVPFGTVTGDKRTTTVTVQSGAALRIDGVLASEVTGLDAHGTLFATVDTNGVSGFRLGEDYDLDIATQGTGAMVVGMNGSARMTNLKLGGTSPLAFEVGADANGQVAAGSLDVLDTFAANGRVEIRATDVFALTRDTDWRQELVSSGTMTGFSGFSFNSLFYGYTVGGDADSLWLDFSRTAATIAGEADRAGANASVSELGHALDSYTYQGTVLEPFMNKLANETSGAVVATAVRQLTNESGIAAANAAALTQRQFLNMTDSFLLGPLGGGTTIAELNGECEPVVCRIPTSWRLRGLASYTRENLSGSDGYSPYRTNSRTLLLAAEHSQGGVTFGVAGGLGWTRTKATDFDNRSKSDDFGILAYGRVDFGSSFVAGRFGYGYSDINSTRKNRYMNESAEGDFSSRFFSAGLYGGHEFTLGNNWALTGVAGGSWLRTRAKGYDERGGDLALRQEGWHGNSFELQAEARLAKTFDICPAKEISLTPRINAGVAYELGDRGVGGKTSFLNAAAFPEFRSESSRVGRLRGIVGAGLDVQLGRNVTLGVEYQGSFRRRAVEHSGQVAVTWSW